MRTLRTTRPHVLICTGNFFPLAFFRIPVQRPGQKRGLNWRATSRGLRTWTADGEGPIPEFAA